MNSIWTWLLGVSLAWLFYAYAGYPALLYLLSRRRGAAATASDAYLPTITILTAAYDEAGVIAENIENKLSLEYPAEKLDMIVISDGSTDGTDEIVAKYQQLCPGRVRLVRQEPRQGKTSGLNLAVPLATGEILVFADANSIYDKSALRHLVARFADASVGYVTGKMIYTNPDGSITGDGCTAYMRYENALRAWETEVGSVVGVDGGIDAVRRTLYQPMRPDHLPDFVLPLRVVEQGYRVAYEPLAVLREPALGTSGQEYRMRVRVALRALWALHDLRHLMNPLRYPLFSWQLVSHKLLRYTAFVPQALALVTNALLASAHPWLAGLLAAQGAFYLLAAAVQWMPAAAARLPLATLAYYLTLLNISCAHAAWRFLRGQKQVLWKPRTG